MCVCLLAKGCDVEGASSGEPMLLSRAQVFAAAAVICMTCAAHTPALAVAWNTQNILVDKESYI